MSAKKPIIPGETFGRLTVIAEAPRGTRGRCAQCRCVCGTIAVVLMKYLRNGDTTSCGCHHQALVRGGMRRTHGGSQGKHPTYHAWHGMNQRCFNPRNASFKNYGGRGITVCERWRHDFATFAADMGPRPSAQHSIERKDNDGPYSPENCIWATKQTQAVNKRSNRRFTYGGETLLLGEWARRCGISRLTLRVRLMEMHWPVEKALTLPVGPNNDKPRHRLLTYQGETHYTSEWARRLDIPVSTLQTRLNREWPIEEVLSRPRRRYPRRG